MQGTRVWSLIGELRSQLPRSNWAQAPQPEHLGATIKIPSDTTKTRHSRVEITKRRKKKRCWKGSWKKKGGWTFLVVQRVRIASQQGEHRFDTWSRRIPHAAKQLSLWATTTEPVSGNQWSPSAWSLCSQQKKTPQLRCPTTATKRSPRSLQPEKAWAQQQRPRAAKNK